jgi:glycosyltransferase involved in cell wall biosynthesis
MNLLMFNLAVDARHVTLAFGLRWIEALATRFEHIDVVTMTMGEHRLPPNVNVWSLGRERGYPEWLRAIRFYWLVLRIMRKRRIDVVFTHMIPLFAVMFWPIAMLARVKNVLWYAHGATPMMLKIAHGLVNMVVSSTPEGFRLPSRKAHFIGQGIDARLFHYRPRQADAVFRVITAGRLALSKGLDVMIEALANWPCDRPWQMTIIGDATSESEQDHARALKRLAASRSHPEQVTFTGRLDAWEIAERLATAHTFVNLGATGSLDKAIVEAMASGCPVVSSNDAFRSIALASGFPHCVVDRDPALLGQTLARLALMDLHELDTLGEQQSRVATRDHALDGLMDKLHGRLVSMARTTTS